MKKTTLFLFFIGLIFFTQAQEVDYVIDNPGKKEIQNEKNEGKLRGITIIRCMTTKQRNLLALNIQEHLIGLQVNIQ